MGPVIRNLQRLRVVPACLPILACLLGGVWADPARSGPPLPPGGDISGRALDAAGRVLAGVEVLVARRGAAEAPPFSVRTDAEGRFLARGLPQAEYLLVATKAGYLAGISQVGRLPAAGVLLVLGLDLPSLREEMTWVLRLPGRDLLRALQAQVGEGSGERPAAAPITTHLEQRFGLSLGDGLADGGAGGPDLGTRLAVAGETAAGVSWRSGARFEDMALGRSGTGPWRQSEDLFLSGGADLSLEDDGWLTGDLRLRRERLAVGSGIGLAENRAAGVDLEARLPGDETRIRFRARALEADPGVARAAGQEGLARHTFGLSLTRAADIGLRHRLTTAVSLRHHQASGADGQVLLGRGAAAPGEADWLVPGASWAAVAIHDRAALGAHAALRFGVEARQPRSRGLVWLPSLEVEWNPTARTGVQAGVSYLDGSGSAPGSRQDPLSAWLALSRAVAGRTRLTLEMSRENLAGRDPLAAAAAGRSVERAGIWTDGEARSRGVRMALDQVLGPVQGRLAVRAGAVSGRLAAPDPFEFTAAALQVGEARFYGLSAGIAVGATGTEVAVALDRVRAAASADYTLVGVQLRQALAAPFRTAGDWQLLLDYEGIEGARPFRGERDPGRVARVSGGVAVRF